MEKSTQNSIRILGISSRIFDKMRVKMQCKNLTVRPFNSPLYIFFYSMKKSYLVLKLFYFKVQYLDFPKKIGNLAVKTLFMKNKK